MTLWACDTGSGEARAGEGVMGLRRGFVEAGAHNLLMTVWPISDEFTVQIMSDFYKAAHRAGNAPQALAEVQRDWLLKLRAEKGLAHAVNLAGAHFPQHRRYIVYLAHVPFRARNRPKVVRFCHYK